VPKGFIVRDFDELACSLACSFTLNVMNRESFWIHKLDNGWQDGRMWRDKVIYHDVEIIVIRGVNAKTGRTLHADKRRELRAGREKKGQQQQAYHKMMI